MFIKPINYKNFSWILKKNQFNCIINLLPQKPVVLKKYLLTFKSASDISFLINPYAR